ncbi:MAG: cysteine desulfurase family protein, partial [bacterium]
MLDLDYNATTPVKDEVREAMEPYLDGKYGNPSSVHQVGQSPKATVENARETIAEKVNAPVESLVITGSGSEANTMAIRGIVRPPYEDRVLVTSSVEHSSVLNTAEWLEQQGAEVRYAPLNEEGQLIPEWFEQNVDKQVDLVSVMRVNNETGVEFPINKIGEICRSNDVLFHSDWIQALGKIPVSYRETPVDLVSFSAHKIGGPKGTGALIAPKTIELTPLVFGGHQERQRRGGTENVAGLAGFARAVSLIDSQQFEESKIVRDRFETGLSEALEDVLFIGNDTDRVPNTSGMVIRGIDGEDVVMKMDLDGI